MSELESDEAETNQATISRQSTLSQGSTQSGKSIKNRLSLIADYLLSITNR